MNHFNKKILKNALLFLEDRFIIGEILIENDKIEDILINDSFKKDFYQDAEIFDCQGAYVSYGFFDPHVHFRVPGNEEKEDWDSGSKAALKGGFTFVIDMPNNTPSAIDQSVLQLKQKIAEKDSLVHYGFYLGLTDKNVDSLPHILAECRKEKIPVYGVKAFLGASTGSLLVQREETIYKALSTGEIVLFHAEDEVYLSKQTDFINLIEHEKSRPAMAEVAAIKKIEKAASTIKEKAKIYICHLSTKKGLEEALTLRENGYSVILEATPHHLMLSLEEIKQWNSPFYKVNPPIRYQKDRDAIRDAFLSGEIDLIGTDHAPHLLREKLSQQPPSGFPGLESAFFVLSTLYQNKMLPLEMILKKLTSGYSIFGIKNRGEIKKGYFADLLLFEKKNFTFFAEKAVSKAKFSPFDCWKSLFSIKMVFVNGKLVYSTS